MHKKVHFVLYLKRTIHTCLALTLSFMCKIAAFGGDTHFAITQSAISTTKLFDKFQKPESTDLEVEIINACNSPDIEETQWFFKWHFYDVIPTESNKLLDILTSENDALSQMNMHYKNGLDFYREGDRLKAISELGNSLHYLQDMCCPVHLLGWSNPNHMIFHKSYEDKMDKLSGKFMYRICQNKFDFRTPNKIGGITNTYPLFAYNDYKNSNNTEPCYEIFENAYQASCELIYLFFKEVGLDL